MDNLLAGPEQIEGAERLDLEHVRIAVAFDAAAIVRIFRIDEVLVALDRAAPWFT